MRSIVIAITLTLAVLTAQPSHAADTRSGGQKLYDLCKVGAEQCDKTLWSLVVSLEWPDVLQKGTFGYNWRVCPNAKNEQSIRADLPPRFVNYWSSKLSALKSKTASQAALEALNAEYNECNRGSKPI